MPSVDARSGGITWHVLLTLVTQWHHLTHGVDARYLAASMQDGGARWASSTCPKNTFRRRHVAGRDHNEHEECYDSTTVFERRERASNLGPREWAFTCKVCLRASGGTSHPIFGVSKGNVNHWFHNLNFPEVYGQLFWVQRAQNRLISTLPCRVLT